MEILENKTVYHCSYCSKYYLGRQHAAKHEDGCMKNPKNKHKCYEGCEHLTRTEGDNGVYYSTCAAQQNKQIYSYRAVHLGLLKKYPESFEDAELMPLECDLFKSWI